MTEEPMTALRLSGKPLLCRHLLVFLSIFPFFQHPCSAQKGRDERSEQFDRIVTAIGVEPGMVIGEAGAGAGDFALLLSKRVGDSGIVYANDISGSALRGIRDLCLREKATNIVTVRGTVTDALFPRDDLEMVYMRHVLHCMEKPLAWLINLRKYLRQDARLVIVECDPDIQGSGWKYLYKRDRVVQIVQEAGFELAGIETFLLPDDYVYIFRIRTPS